jgi:hypothetical protein
MELSDRRFVNVVWPEIGGLWFPGAKLRPVQTEDSETLRVLDAVGGVDYVLDWGNTLANLAVRVLSVGPFDSFTLGETELARRRRAILLRNTGPDYVVQAYVGKDETFQYVLCAPLEDVVNCADERPGPELRNRTTGAPFTVVWGGDLGERSHLLRRMGHPDALIKAEPRGPAVPLSGADWLGAEWICRMCGARSSSYTREVNAAMAAIELAAWLLEAERLRAPGGQRVPAGTRGELTAELALVLRRWPDHAPELGIVRAIAAQAYEWADRHAPPGDRVWHLWMAGLAAAPEELRGVHARRCWCCGSRDADERAA